MSVMPAPLPVDEPQRLTALRDYDVLDTPAEVEFDRVVQLAGRTLRAPTALISLLDEGRQWFKARVGLAAQSTPRDQSFCGYAILSDAVLVVEDALADPRFEHNPLVVGAPGIRAYLGAPLRTPNGRIGTLCVIDYAPRVWTEAEKASLADIAAMLVSILELRRTGRDLQLFRRLVEASPAEMAVIDPRRGIILYRNGALAPRGPKEDTNPTGALTARVHPDDQVRLMSHLKLGEGGEGLAPFELTVRAGSVADGWRWWTFRGRPVGEPGEPVLLVVSINDVTAMHEANHRLEALSRTDALTGLANRRALQERLTLASAEAARGRPFSVALVDLDHFKALNDTKGHAAGDTVLVAVGSTLRDGLRANDLVARYGGEEFCLVLAGLGADEAVRCCERLRRAIEGLGVTASFGVAAWYEGTDPVARADSALYVAKAAGRNQVRVSG